MLALSNHFLLFRGHSTEKGLEICAQLSDHMDQIQVISKLKGCPQGSNELEFRSDFRAHFEDVHCIEEPRSNCVSRKRKCKDKGEEMQDTKDEALNHEQEGKE
jgi:hypothetical protein